MDNLFNALDKLFGSKFSSQWGKYDATGAWWAELQHVTPGQLAIGLRRVRQQIQDAARQSDEVWPPMPIAFSALCQPKPEDLGLPITAEAWREATGNAHQPGQHRWSHEAVRLAGQAVGWWDLTHGGGESRTDRLEQRFRKEYSALVNRVMAGEQLQAYGLLIHRSKLTAFDLAERASVEAAQKQAEAAGMPDRMNSEQAFRLMRANLGGR